MKIEDLSYQPGGFFFTGTLKDLEYAERLKEGKTKQRFIETILLTASDSPYNKAKKGGQNGQL